MVMQAPMPVILDAWAPWCQPCLQLAPKLEAEVRAQNGRLRLAKVNTDDNQRIAQQLQITVSKRESMTGLSVCLRVRVRDVVCWRWCTMVHARRVVKVCNVCSRLAVWRGVCDVCTSDVYQYTKQTSTMMCTHTHVVGWMAYCDTYATHVTAILPLSRWQRHPSVPYSIPCALPPNCVLIPFPSCSRSIPHSSPHSSPPLPPLPPTPYPYYPGPPYGLRHLRGEDGRLVHRHGTRRTSTGILRHPPRALPRRGHRCGATAET